MFEVKVLADSLGPNGSRLTTLEMTYCRIIHSEHLRHRAFSPNVASSRAIPVQKMIRQVLSNPFVPIHWGRNQKGMQAHSELTGIQRFICRQLWLKLRFVSVAVVWMMVKLSLHKQIANRLLEPWMWCTVICTGTDRAWRHFDGLRIHKMAEPHIRKVAEMSQAARAESVPKRLNYGEAHLPLFGFPGDELVTDLLQQMKISAGRCARVSYLTHDGRRDVVADVVLCDQLINDLHWSPTEHQAVATEETGVGGNFGDGWKQFRKTFPNEFTA